MRVVTFLLFISSAIFAQNMIADIQHPVDTDFGVYTPRSVTITPNAPVCESGDNLENVVNLSDYVLSDIDTDLLKKNGFFVTPATMLPIISRASGFNEMFDIYNDCRESGIPIFVTSDALLHTFHLCFDYILRTCEEKRFYADLELLLHLLFEVTMDQYETATDSTVRQACQSNMNYLIVALRLLDPSFVEPINGGPYIEELTLIESAAGFAESPIFGYDEDYSQYIPRGHYTRTDSLKRYFKTMMWLGRMSFACELVADPVSRDATRRALLLIQAMHHLKDNGIGSFQLWDNIYQPTVFFVGKSDDITIETYFPMAEELYKLELSPDIFADDSLLTQFLFKTEKLPGSAITYPGQPSKGFRFMGQRFIPDSWILDELVYTKIPDRMMPTGLDVMIVLGSEKAYEYLPQQDKDNVYYNIKLDSLKKIFRSYPSEIWAQNAYWNWLYSLMPLLAVKGAGYPAFMQNAAWVDKDLYAALASWAELRHDTILYAKQSGTDTGMDPSSYEVQGYVEPNPHFFGRLAALAEFMMEGLNNRNLLFDQFKTSLEKLSRLLDTLKTISEKELTGISLNSDEYLTIFEIGKDLYDIVTFGRWPSEGPFPGMDDLEPMPVVADVHTEPFSATVLEEGVGYPYAIYVICNIEGHPILAKGAGFSYYEFTWPMNDRLTDEKWRDMLKKGEQPKRPEWTSSFMSEPERANPAAEFYSWRKPMSEFVKTNISPEKPIAGDTLTVTMIFSNWESQGQPVVELYDSQGDKHSPLSVTVQDNNQSKWLAIFMTATLPDGRTYIDINYNTGYGTLEYRTSVFIQPASRIHSVATKPEEKYLYQNYPNPFNPVTTIRFDLPYSSNVVLDIFNVNGRLVNRIWDGDLESGSHFLVWNGRDRENKVLGTGVYFYRMRTGDYISVKQMLLLK
ncbi:DUF3160 domain-containing protein [candidate division KSB1 bacterium]|nr:DUF3160 domain-containing protein [candidate division KSB1 bacterium]